jgi:hypothetical protein
MKLAALFLWLALPLAGYLTYVTHGTPHMIWSYEFHDNGSRYDLTVPRHYTSCTYVGWGWKTVTASAVGARCPWVRLFKSEAHGV